jgi:RNA polymerase sigma factor (sigma-70 family)
VPDRTPDWDAQDKRDRELLARGAIDELVAGYYDVVVGRCRNRCGAQGEDVAQQVFLRLLRELADGKHRDGTKPFREIVNGVVYFACKGWEGSTLGRDAPYEDWTAENEGGAQADIAGDVATRLDLEAFVASLPPGDGEIARLRFIELLEIDQIAEATGKQRNAVDQALYRIRRKWTAWNAS